MGLPCEPPPALHPGRGWGLRGLFHAKSLLDPPLPGSCLRQWVLLHFYPWGKELLGSPVVGTLLRGGPVPLDKGPPALPVPWQDLL